METKIILIYDSCFAFRLCTIWKIGIALKDINPLNLKDNSRPIDVTCLKEYTYFNAYFYYLAELLSSSLGEEAIKMALQNTLMHFMGDFSYLEIYRGQLFSLI